ncbi:type II secretion system F family protein [bacterium]
MGQYKYRVRTQKGEILEGTLEAPNERVVMDKIKSQNLVLLNLEELSGGNFLTYLSKFKKRAKQKDIVLFSRQLSTLISAGVPIIQSMTVIQTQIENPKFRLVVRKMKDDIESGMSISDSMAQFDDVFSELYISMIHAGEVGGILDAILGRLANYLEASQEMKSKVKGALVYPAIVSVVAASATIFLLTVVIPSFEEMFVSMGGELPLPTQMLLDFSEFMKSYVWVFLVIIGASIAGLRHYYKNTKEGRLKIDGYILKLPLFGLLLKKVAVAKFARTLGTLLKSGVVILQAMETVAKTSGNKVIEEIIMGARTNIREGERIAEPLRKSGVFPPMVSAMISIGEETGKLDDMLEKISDFYDKEVSTAIAALLAMIEPLIIVVMGIVLGGIIIAMLLPMFEMSSLAGG